MPARFRRVTISLVVFALLCACASRDVSSNLPDAAQGVQRSAASSASSASIPLVSRASVPLASTDVVAIDAGGPATGGFAADEYYSVAGTYSSDHPNTISTAGITNPAPQAVYQTERVGPTITYTIPGLTSGAAYTVKLSFAETFFTSAGKRVFNVAIDGTTVLSNFDIFAAAGANKAIVESFPATASASGTITIVLTATTNNAVVSAIEIATAGSTPAPTPTPTAPGASILDIDAGGAAAGAFVADTDYTAAGSYSSSTTSAIDTSAVSDPAPQAVYQTIRLGKSVTYTIPGLKAGATYGVRFDFAETFWSASGKRVFNASINGTQVLTNFDVYQTAGAKDKAIAESFSTVATSTGTIVISLAAIADNAAINGIEITSGAGSPTSPPTSTPTPGATPTPVPTATPSTTLVDWPTYGYDAQRDGFNPSTTAFTPGSLSALHKVWNVTGSGATQPIVATNAVPGHPAVLIVGTGNGDEKAFDAYTGAKLWSVFLGRANQGACGVGGIAGAAQYDAALRTVFVAGGNSATLNHVVLYGLNVATGAIVNSVDVSTNLLAGESTYSHTAVTLANNTLYIGTGSNCEAASWRGEVIGVNPTTFAVTGRFYTTWNQGGAWGGGGVWGWGGVSADPSGNIFVGSGNAETSGTIDSGTISSPFVAAPSENSGYAEHLTEVNSSLTSVVGSNKPTFNFAIGGSDLDFSGTPVVFHPPGCDELVAGQGKGGTLVVADTTNLAGSGVSYAFSKPSAGANYIGNPGYSPVTGLLYAAINSGTDSLYPPGLAAISSCGQSVMWHAQFGPDSFSFSGENPRSAPTVTAGGVVFIATPCTASGSTCGTPGTVNGAVWAVSATTGAVLNGGNPVLITGDSIRMAPTVDGLWMWVSDQSGNLYGLTLDPSVLAKPAVAPVRLPRAWRPS